MSEGVPAVLCCCVEPAGGWYEVFPTYCAEEFVEHCFPAIDTAGEKIQFAMRLTLSDVESLSERDLKPAGEGDWGTHDGIQMWTLGDYLGPDDGFQGRLSTSLGLYSPPNGNWLIVPFNGTEASTVPTFGLGSPRGLWTTIPPPRFSLVGPGTPQGDVQTLDVMHMVGHLFYNPQLQVRAEWNAEAPTGFNSINQDSAWTNWYNPMYRVSNRSYTAQFIGGGICVINKLYESTFPFNGNWEVKGIVQLPGYSATGNLDPNFQIVIFPGQAVGQLPNLPPEEPFNGRIYTANNGGVSLGPPFVAEFETIAIDSGCPTVLSNPLPEVLARWFSAGGGPEEPAFHTPVVRNDDYLSNPCDATGVDPCPTCEAPSFPPGPPGSQLSSLGATSCPNALECNEGACDVLAGQYSADTYFANDQTVVFNPFGDPPHWCRITVFTQQFEGFPLDPFDFSGYNYSAALGSFG